MRLNPPIFIGTKVEEDPQRFIDELEKNFRVMYTNEVEGLELVAYQLKDMANQWYNEWEDSKGSNVKPSILGEFVEAFLDHFFPQELRKSKAKEFMNLK